MRTFNVRGHCPRHKKVYSFMALKSLSLAVQRLLSKAFSLVCSSRFSEFLPLTPIATQSLGGEKRVKEGLDFKEAPHGCEKRGNW
jgi:hypothetical protein